MKLTEIKKLQDVLSEFRKISPDLTVNQVLTFLEVSKGNGAGSHEIEKLLSVTQAAASRNLRYFDQYQSAGKPGKNLFIERIDPAKDLRAKVRFLNKDGEALLANVEAILKK